MINKVTKLRDLKLDSNAYLTEYIIENSNDIDPNKVRPAIVICPGGGYSALCAREAEPIALSFLAQGFSAFVLYYSVAPNKYPLQLLEASLTISYIRNNAENFNIDKNKIFICGFSAGGHLAASLGTLWDDKIIIEKLGIDYGDNKPNGTILCYPVIKYGKKMHKGSFDNLIGEYNKELCEKLSLEKSVSKNTPPAFIWHTITDKTVPVENSLVFANALCSKNIPFELHIFPSGRHGMALCNNVTAGTDQSFINTHCECWIDLCVKWILNID